MRSKRPATVADVVRILERLAPPELAEAWDNCGLQVGAMDQAVGHVWVALDPSPPVIEGACEDGADLLITHHPLLFKPLKRIDLATATGRAIARALGAGLSLYAAHTNLDSAVDGLNDLLARRLQIAVRQPLAGRTAPAGAPAVGLGRLGRLAAPMRLAALARHAGSRLGMTQVTTVGDPDRIVQEAALCTGSGGSLVAEFLTSSADVFITGEIRYHEAREILDAGRSAVDIGHFASERIMIDDVAARLAHPLEELGVRLTACSLERDPFGRVEARSCANGQAWQ
jgi:dinuclear metal center YbgI/SA1388 family protein